MKTRRFYLPWAVMLLVFGGISGHAVAESAPPAGAEFREPDEATQPQRLVGIAIYLLVTITVLTVSLLILLILWGVRVRRQVRKPFPAIKPTDPLWYLKTKRHPPGEPGRSASVSEREEPPERPSAGSSSGG